MLAFSTYLGGTGDEGARAALAFGGTILVTGTTTSADFPTVDPFQASPGGGGEDAFAAVLGELGPLLVEVDIRPFTRFNWIVPWLRWPVAVAILSTDDFDARSVEAASVRFGPGEAEPLARQLLRDVDGDGDPDLVLRFFMNETGIRCSDREATFSGRTSAGWAFSGSDRVVPLLCHR